MKRVWIVFVVAGLSWGCHPDHKKPKPDPKLVLDPDAELQDWTAELSIDNACAEVVDLVASTTSASDDEAIRLSIEPGEVVVWSFQADEKLWRAPDDHGAIEVFVNDDSTAPQLTLDCDG